MDGIWSPSPAMRARIDKDDLPSKFAQPIQFYHTFGGKPVNPAYIHNYAKSKLLRNKTDKVDAKLIANYCATQASLVQSR